MRLTYVVCDDCDYQTPPLHPDEPAGGRDVLRMLGWKQRRVRLGWLNSYFEDVCPQCANKER